MQTAETTHLDTAEAAQLRHARRRPGLSPADIALMLKMSSEGKTQAEIGQRFGVDRSYISKVLSEFTDTTELAKSHLRASALSMSRNIVKNGRAADHVAALKGLSVLKDEQQTGVTVIVGGSGQVNIGIALSPQLPSATGEGAQYPQQYGPESDNQSYVNEVNLLTDKD